MNSLKSCHTKSFCQLRRREALSGLALIYKNYLMDPDNVPQATKSAIGWIRDKILHGKNLFYLNNKNLFASFNS